MVVPLIVQNLDDASSTEDDTKLNLEHSLVCQMMSMFSMDYD